MRSTAALQDTLASLEKSSRVGAFPPSSPRTPPLLNHSWLLDLPPNTQSFGSLCSTNRYSCVDVIQKPNLTYDLRRYSTVSAVHQSPQRQLEEALDAFPIPNASYIRTSSEATLHPLSPGSPVRPPPPAAAPTHHDYYPHHQLSFPHLSLTLPSPSHTMPERSYIEAHSPSAAPSFTDVSKLSPGAHPSTAEPLTAQGALSPTSTIPNKRISTIVHDKSPLDGATATPRHDAEATGPASSRHCSLSVYAPPCHDPHTRPQHSSPPSSTQRRLVVTLALSVLTLVSFICIWPASLLPGLFILPLLLGLLLAVGTLWYAHTWLYRLAWLDQARRYLCGSSSRSSGGGNGQNCPLSMVGSPPTVTQGWHSKRTASGGSRLPWAVLGLTTHSSVSAAHLSSSSSHRSSTIARTRSHDLAHSPAPTVDEKHSYTLPSPRNRCTLEFPASFMYLPSDTGSKDSKVII